MRWLIALGLVVLVVSCSCGKKADPDQRYALRLQMREGDDITLACVKQWTMHEHWIVISQCEGASLSIPSDRIAQASALPVGPPK